ncbi:sugar transferase [Pseudonocardia sp.]|uniref:sugar transferase n=1 Tax=Pseudonocardia sp. TaxID=60912 RepID=UPI003D101883
MAGPSRTSPSADTVSATLPLGVHKITPKTHLDRPLEPQHASRWEWRYKTAVVTGDIGVIVLGALAGGLLGLGNGSTGVWASWYLAGAVTLLMVACVATCGAWDIRVLGQGSEEFGRVLRGVVLGAVVLGLVGLAFELTAVRPWVFGIIPVIGIVTELLRYGLRRMVHRRRRQGRCMRTVLAVGTASSVAELITRTRRAKYSGWTVTGVCTPDGRGLDGENHVLDVPVVGDLDNLPLAVGLDQYRVVAVTPTPELAPKRLHRLAWELEGSGAEMVVDPGLMEIAGPRLHVAPVDGLPLLRVTEPAFTGIARVLKTVVDRTVAGTLILMLLPVLLAVAIAIKADGGPVFFRQVRLGQGGRPFPMVKFRSMVVNAERLRSDLLTANEGAGPLFKMARDPRVTAVGAWLRRYSLDELPQLFNVLTGSMSLVGPRPPLPEEARGYTPEAQRRLLVKPGMTGLWQVSGRSDLSWEESVRLDLRYVENWSMALDAMILWKTIGAVVTGRGAY